MPKPAISQDERQLIRLVEKMHLSEEDKISGLNGYATVR